jgi:hypothetical protein
MPYRVWAIILLGVGVAVFAMARQIATWKTRAWAKFYAQHPGAAEIIRYPNTQAQIAAFASAHSCGDW